MTSTSTTPLVTPISGPCHCAAAGLLAVPPGGHFASLINRAVIRPGAAPGQLSASGAKAGQGRDGQGQASPAAPICESETGTAAEVLDSQPPCRAMASRLKAVSNSGGGAGDLDDRPGEKGIATSLKSSSQEDNIPAWLASWVAGASWQLPVCAPAQDSIPRAATPACGVAGVGAEAKEGTVTNPLDLLAGSIQTGATSTTVPGAAETGLSPLLSKILQPGHPRSGALSLEAASDAKERVVGQDKIVAAPEAAENADLGLAAHNLEGNSESATRGQVEFPPKIGSSVASPAQTSADQRPQALLERSVREQAPNSAVTDEHGMSDALPSETMQATLEVNGSSGATEQNLPINSGTADPVHASGRSRALFDGTSESESELSGGAAVGPFYSASQSTDQDHASQVVAPAASRSAQTAVEHAALGLPRDAGTSVSLVLRPDGDTQLALHVKWNRGQLDALAVVERGDFNMLGANWSQLQHRLAEHGVRLAPLSEGSDNFGSSAGGQSRPGKQDSQAGNSMNRWDDMPQLAPRLTRQNTTPMVHRPTLKGREWWA